MKPMISGKVGFGDVLQSGRTYEQLIKDLCKYVSDNDIQEMVYLLAEIYGGDKNKKNVDLQLKYSRWENDDGDYVRYIFATTDMGNGCFPDGIDFNRSKCVYEVCMADSDDNGSVGECNLHPSVRIPVYLESGDVKYTTLQYLWDDCLLHMMKCISGMRQSLVTKTFHSLFRLWDVFLIRFFFGSCRIVLNLSHKLFDTYIIYL